MVVSPFGLTLEQLARAHAMMGDNDAAQVVSGLSHSLEKCRPRRSHLQASEGGIREVAQASSYQPPASSEELSAISRQLSETKAVQNFGDLLTVKISG